MGKGSELLTEGVIWRRILVFSIPLIVGNLFQQLYNTVDTLVIGNFLGGNALAAVGAGTVVIHLMLSLFTGLATGASVVIAQCFGAGDRRMVRRAVHTSAAFTLLFGVLMTIVGVGFSGPMLRWIDTPDIVLRDARVYLQIYFSGIIPLMIYNMGAGVLRAVGDSRTPLYYLAFAAVLNTVLDVLFVAAFGMGVEGVAVATLIAQIAAAVLIVLKMQRTTEVYRLRLRNMRLEPRILLRILKVGVPAGLQQMTMGLSNLVVQSTVNGFGTTAMAAWNVYNKIDTIAILPVISFGLAMMTFTGQNVGAGLRDRVYEGTRTGLKMSCGFAVVISILFCLFGVRVFALFSADPEILEYGRRMIYGVAPFYFLVALMYSYSGVINGAGHSLPTMIIMLSSLCVARIAFLWLMKPFIPDIHIVFFAYIVSWALCSFGLAVYYKKGAWRKELQ